MGWVLGLLVLVVAVLSGIAAFLWCIHRQQLRDSDATTELAAALGRQLADVAAQWTAARAEHLAVLRALEGRIGQLRESFEGPPSLRRPPISVAPTEPRS